MHEIKAKGILSSQGGINLYRGCTHGCIYCDSRSACYQMDHDFQDVAVKVNGLSLLEEALRRKRRPTMVGFGFMSDPYMPLERELRQTRGALELLAAYGFGVAVQTKSDLVMRDLDLLAEIHGNAKAVVQVTLTTYDLSLIHISMAEFLMIYLATMVLSAILVISPSSTSTSSWPQPPTSWWWYLTLTPQSSIRRQIRLRRSLVMSMGRLVW